MRSESKLVTEAVKLRNELVGSNWDIDALMRIYLKTPVSEYFDKKPKRRSKRLQKR